MIPLSPTLALAIAVAAGAGGAWVGYSWRDYTALRAERLAAQDARDKARLNRGLAQTASLTFQKRESHAEANFRARTKPFNDAMLTPVAASCPAFADVPVPAGVLDGLRDAWGEPGAATPASGPGRAMQGASDPAGGGNPGAADAVDQGDHP